MALRGIESYSASSGSCAMVIPPSSLMRLQPDRAVRAGAGQDDAHRARLLRLAERAEEEIDRRVPVALRGEAPRPAANHRTIDRCFAGEMT